MARKETTAKARSEGMLRVVSLLLVVDMAWG